MISLRAKTLACLAALSLLPGCWFMMPEKPTWTSARTVSATTYGEGRTISQPLGLEADGNRLVLLDGGFDQEAKALARVDGFDGSADIVLIPEREPSKGHYLYVPVRAAEPRTKVFHVVRNTSDPNRLASATELRDIARVAVWPGGWHGHVVAARLPSGPEPDLYVPLNDDGATVTLTKGIVGVRPLLAAPDTGKWRGWLVRWQDGWSFTGDEHADQLLKDPWDKDVHWSTLTVKNVSENGYLAGTIAGGTCQAMRIVTADHHGLTSYPSCDEAIAALDANVRKVAADLAAEEAKNRPAAPSLPAAKEPTKEEQEAARIAAVEKAAFADYMKAVAIPDYNASCAAGNKMREKTHAELLGWRFKTVEVHGQELFCYRGRKDAVAANTKRFEERWQEQGRAAAEAKEAELRARLNRHTYTPGQGTGGPSAAERLKQSNDYTYGSGKASSCPFTDRSLCN